MPAACSSNNDKNNFYAGCFFCCNVEKNGLHNYIRPNGRKKRNVFSFKKDQKYFIHMLCRLFTYPLDICLVAWFTTQKQMWRECKLMCTSNRASRNIIMRMSFRSVFQHTRFVIMIDFKRNPKINSKNIFWQKHCRFTKEKRTFDIRLQIENATISNYPDEPKQEISTFRQIFPSDRHLTMSCKMNWRARTKQPSISIFYILYLNLYI